MVPDSNRQQLPEDLVPHRDTPNSKYLFENNYRQILFKKIIAYTQSDIKSFTQTGSKKFIPNS